MSYVNMYVCALGSQDSRNHKNQSCGIEAADSYPKIYKDKIKTEKNEQTSLRV